ncbi:tryptophan--tRNA ligase, partial [bacterium]|nr:tryptophan--tRNA ligase [bacterium]
PVGKDQLPHLELAREITRRFNHLYKKSLFPEAKDMLTEIPLLPGTDGRKMSKSYGNTIPISDDPDSLQKKVMKMKTDPNRIRRDDPGNPDICPVFAYHKIFNTSDQVQTIDADCRKGTIGCVDCKKACAKTIIDTLAPVTEKRRYFETHTDEVMDVLKAGAKKARPIAQRTISEVREAIGL